MVSTTQAYINKDFFLMNYVLICPKLNNNGVIGILNIQNQMKEIRQELSQAA